MHAAHALWQRFSGCAVGCRYQKGQHVICASAALVEQHLKAAGSAGLVIDPQKIVWVPYIPDREYDK